MGNKKLIKLSSYNYVRQLMKMCFNWLSKQHYLYKLTDRRKKKKDMEHFVNRNFFIGS